MNGYASAVKKYQRYCPQTLKAFVRNEMKQPVQADVLEFETLAMLYGQQYVTKWNKELEAQRNEG